MQSLNWDDLRVFLAVARGGRLLVAARRLNVDHSTVARRITALEAAVGARLLDRTPRGVTLTQAGEAILAHAERIEGEIIEASTAIGEHEAGAVGTVRLATPEAFGTHLVAPNVRTLLARHPQIRLELTSESRIVSLSKREADVAVGLNRPVTGRVIARKLIDYRVGLYGTPEYLAAHPPIERFEDLRNHRLVWFIDELISIPELRYFEQAVTDVPTVFRSSSINVQQSAVASGLGLGVLHVYVAGRDPRLVRVFPDVEIKRSYWLMFHADQQRLPRVRAVIDFVDGLIEANRAHF